MKIPYSSLAPQRKHSQSFLLLFLYSLFSFSLIVSLLFATGSSATINKPETLSETESDENATLSAGDINGIVKALSAVITFSTSEDGEVIAVPKASSPWTTIPAGMVAPFDLRYCPIGWREYNKAKGRFIRGVDADHALGSTQEDAGRNVTGTLRGIEGGINQAYNWGFSSLSDGIFSAPSSRNGSYNKYNGKYQTTNIAFGLNVDASRVWGTEHTADEFRPDNVALLYCRKN